MKKRLLAMLLAGAMVLGMAACGQTTTDSKETGTVKEESKESAKESTAQPSTATSEEAAAKVNMDGFFPICEEPITISVTGVQSATPDWNATDIVQYISEEMGITLDCAPHAGDAWDTQFTLMLSSDELPDMCIALWLSLAKANEYGKEGYFLPINEYLEYMPNFSAFLEKYPDYKKAITADDGNIYGLAPYDENAIGALQRTFINQVWLDNVGKEIPTTVDELYDVLKAFKEQDANGNGDPNDEIPLTGEWYRLMSFLHSFGVMSNNMVYSPLVDENGVVSLGQASEGYRAALSFLNKLYEDGLLDKDALTQTTDEMNAKAAADRIGMFPTGGAPFVSAGKNIDYDANWVWVDGLISDYNEKQVAVYNSTVADYAKIVVSAETEHPEAICRLIDYFYTDEGAVLASRGVEGKGMAWQDVAYLPGVKTAEKVNGDESQYTSAEEYRYKKGLINNGFNLRVPYAGTMNKVLVELDDATLAKEEVLLGQGWACLIERGRRGMESETVFPVLVYNDDESSRRSTIKTDIDLYAQQAMGQFITGELDIESDADWDTYLKNLEAAGMSEIVAIEQAAYDRFNKN